MTVTGYKTSWGNSAATEDIEAGTIRERGGTELADGYFSAVRAFFGLAVALTRTSLSVSADNAAYLNSDLELFIGSQDELIVRLDELVMDTAPHLVVTPNVDMVLQLDTNPEALRAMSEASLRVVDGMPLIALLKMVGASKPTRHTGADLLPLMAQLSAERGWRVAIVGGQQGVAAEACTRLRERHVGSQLFGFELPRLQSASDPVSRNTVAVLNELEPSIVFVCLGFPLQESWFLHWRDSLPGAVYVGAGAAVDFAAGTVERAPKLVQKSGFEWAYRLKQEPRRLARRYLLTGPRFLFVIAASLSKRRSSRTAPVPPTSDAKTLLVSDRSFTSVSQMTDERSRKLG